MCKLVHFVALVILYNCYEETLALTLLHSCSRCMVMHSKIWLSTGQYKLSGSLQNVPVPRPLNDVIEWKFPTDVFIANEEHKILYKI